MKALKKRLDRVFSEFIRTRDSNAEGYGKCCTCGVWKHKSVANAGHFIKRQHTATRYDERNCHFQCVVCNFHRHGNLIEYCDFMRDRYGVDAIDELRRLQHTTVKFGRDDLNAMIERYSA
jgi:hypothetical protein